VFFRCSELLFRELLTLYLSGLEFP
jgi:hypothetical protein